MSRGSFPGSFCGNAGGRLLPPVLLSLQIFSIGNLSRLFIACSCGFINNDRDEKQAC
jgi:hypothetical protein